VLVTRRMYVFQASDPDSRPPPVCFSPPNAPPISAPLVPVFTLTMPLGMLPRRAPSRYDRASSRVRAAGARVPLARARPATQVDVYVTPGSARARVPNESASRRCAYANGVPLSIVEPMEHGEQSGDTPQLAAVRRPEASVAGAFMRADPYARLLVGLIGVDLVSKLLADVFVPRGDIDSSAAFQLVLRWNRGPSTELLARLRGQDSHILAATGVAIVATAFCLIRTRRIETTLRRRVLLNAGVYLTTALVASMALRGFGEMSMLAVLMFLGACQAFLFMALWALLLRGPWKFAVTFLAAAAFGNGISRIVPPFGVTDFIQIRWVSKAFSIGTFNLADVYSHAGKWLLVVAAAASVARWINTRRVQSAR